MKKKAVFFDIDGTLYDIRTGICDSTKEALKRLGENGHYAFICTGRTKVSIFDPELLALGFDGMVAGCGTYLMKGNEVLLNYEIPMPKLQKTLELMEQYRMKTVLEGADYMYYDRRGYMEGKDPYMQMMERLIPEHLTGIKENEHRLRVNKFCVRYEDEKLAEEGIRRLSEDYEIMHHEGGLKELVPKGYSKATGIEYMCRFLDVEHADTYALGDSDNDVEMLRFAGCGIAMGNGTPEAKDAADYVTKGIHEDGVYLALERFGLI